MRPSVRSAALPLLLALSLAAPAVAARAEPASAAIQRFQGAKIPALKAADREGKPVSLAELRGRIVIINLWASWCAPCQAEMPSLERLAALHENDLTILAISTDSKGWGAVDRFWGARYSHLRVALASGPELAESLGAIALPYSLIVDREGREIARVPQAVEWDEGAIGALIDRSIRAEADKG